MHRWPSRPTWQLAFFLVVAGLVFGTTWPWSAFEAQPDWSRVEWMPRSKRAFTLDFALNVLIFVPFGGAARLGWSKRRRMFWLTLAWGFSLLAETAQAFSPLRFPATDDVVANTVGAWIGIWLADRAARRWGQV